MMFLIACVLKKKKKKEKTLSTLHIYFLLFEMPYLLLHSFITLVFEWVRRKQG